MFFRKLFFLFLIITVNFSFAQKQRKRKVDTVYVYEKVVIYDTVYLMKPVKFKQNDLLFSDLKVEETKFVRNIYKEEVEKQRAINRARNRKIRTSHYGFEAGIGLKNSSWAKELSNQPQVGENLGIWFSKDIINPNLSLQLSANIYHWDSTFDLDANKEETYLDGFYFSQDNQPLLFQRFNNKHFEYALQLKLFYEWKNIRPFAGFLVNRNTYKMQFLVPENGVLDKLDDFKSNQTNMGFSVGVQYRLFRRILLTLDYQQYQMNNISLKNSSFDFDIFKTNNTFAERKINFGISYSISKP
jgi:opacity protein-like surface antigen